MTVVPNYKKLESFGFEPFTALEIATGGWSINELVIQIYQSKSLCVGA
jgi:mannose-6-phosphate isomerase-like protein (cupin superfamily)